jgi:hypothetical protein
MDARLLPLLRRRAGTPRVSTGLPVISFIDTSCTDWNVSFVQLSFFSAMIALRHYLLLSQLAESDLIPVGATGSPIELTVRKHERGKAGAEASG